MATIKYDVSNVEDIADRTPAPVGVYRAKVVKAEPKQSSNKNQMIEVQYRLTHDGAGKKLKEEYGDVWDYPIIDHDHPFVQARFKEFIQAFGLKPKGALDTDKIVGKSIQVKLKSDTDQDGEYRPRVGKLMALAAEEAPEEEEDDATEEDDDEELDLDAMSRQELKALIKSEGLDIKVLKSMSDDDLRAAIAELMGDEEEEEEDTDEEDEEEEDDTEEEDDAEDEEEGDNYDNMSAADLKAELAERELPTNGAKKVLIARLRKDDSDSPF
jgi:hypothetical protein